MDIRTEDLLSIPQAAKFLGKTEAAVWWYLQEGQLKGIKIGSARVITLEELERFHDRREAVKRAR